MYNRVWIQAGEGLLVGGRVENSRRMELGPAALVLVGRGEKKSLVEGYAWVRQSAPSLMNSSSQGGSQVHKTERGRARHFWTRVRVKSACAEFR